MELEAPTRNEKLNRHWLEQIVTRSSEAVLLIDARKSSLPVVYVNPAFESLTGYSASEVLGSPWQPLQRDREPQGGLDELRGAMDRSEAIEVDLPDIRKDGAVWFSRINFSPLYDVKGDVRFFLILQRESVATTPERTNLEVGLLQRELGRARQKIDNMNRMDQVTGLLRYEHFLDVLNRDLGIAQRDRRPITIMMFEIVELDVYRNTFGEKAAESCLRMIAAQVSGNLRRAGDLCARMSDSVIVASVLGQEAAQATVLVDRIVANVRGLKLHNPRGKSGRYVNVAPAIVGGVPAPGDDPQGFVERAKRELFGTDASRKSYA